MKKILIANRGEIAVRIIRTCREMGIVTMAVASDADAQSLHAELADECYLIGPAPVSESYLRGDKIIEIALQHGADAIHPGFGFLSENAGFARAVKDAGLIFIGPEPNVIETMGSKQKSKRLMIQAGVPTVPGYTGDRQDGEHLLEEAKKIGFPVLIKASAGGGGKGMRIVHSADRFIEELETARREAKSAFGDDVVLLEKYLTRPRHIEFQVFGDSHGNVVHLFERECSIQRRHQKILEETPSTAMTPQLRKAMGQAAVAAATSSGYTNAGTVEFMLDEDGSFYFLEMNTRLQVEHPITEMLTGLDLVRWQILVALGRPLPCKQEEITARGHSIEVRVYAEDPQRNFFPQTGRIVRYIEPEGLGLRIDSGIREGDEISIFYDPMVSKLIAWGATREEACQKLSNALEEYCVHGVKTNMAFLKAIIGEPHFIKGDIATDYLEKHFKEFSEPDELVDWALALTAMAGTGMSQKQSTVARVVDPWERLSSWRGGQ